MNVYFYLAFTKYLKKETTYSLYSIELKQWITFFNHYYAKEQGGGAPSPCFRRAWHNHANSRVFN